MEQRDLYDENRNITGKTIFKNEKMPKGYFILMVVAFIQDSEGKFLIQKRSEEKGGKWAFTGGHPKAGETSLQGIKTEIKEELGINAENPILFKKASGKGTYCDLYYINMNVNLNDLVIQKEEVDEVKFATKEEIKEMFKNGIFKKGHYMMFKDCLYYLDNI